VSVGFAVSDLVLVGFAVSDFVGFAVSDFVGFAVSDFGFAVSDLVLGFSMAVFAVSDLKMGSEANQVHRLF
jgi:hypothetical protein